MFLANLLGNFISNFAIDTKRSLRKDLQADVLGMALKILVGAILTAVIIGSLGAIGEKLNALLLEQENGMLLSILGLTLVAGTCGLLLGLVMRPKPQPHLIPLSKTSELERIAGTFVHGLVDGFTNRPVPVRPSRRRLAP